MRPLRAIHRLLASLALLLIISACGGGAATPTPSLSAPAASPTAAAPSATSAASPTTGAATPDATGTTTLATVTPEPAPASPTSVPDVTALPAGSKLVLMTHDSFDISPEVVAEFEQATGAKLEILQSGDTGETLNRAILSKAAPLADVLFGVDNTFFSRAIEADIFEPYKPAGSEDLRPDLLLDPQYRLTPIDHGFVTINYDKEYFQQHNLQVPSTLEDLAKPEYKGLLVVENPAKSSPGLAFLLATISYFGEQGSYTWANYWQDLRANEVLVVDSWELAYYEQFSGASGGQGTLPLVVSYATSPAAEVFFSEGKLEDPPTGNLLPARGVFHQVEFAGILKGTKNLALAQRWMDFMLTRRFQDDIPLKMFVYPATQSAVLPGLFQMHAQVPSQPASLAPEQIAAGREGWIREWTRVVLQ